HLRLDTSEPTSKTHRPAKGNGRIFSQNAKLCRRNGGKRGESMADLKSLGAPAGGIAGSERLRDDVAKAAGANVAGLVPHRGPGRRAPAAPPGPPEGPPAHGPAPAAAAPARARRPRGARDDAHRGRAPLRDRARDPASPRRRAAPRRGPDGRDLRARSRGLRL